MNTKILTQKMFLIHSYLRIHSSNGMFEIRHSPLRCRSHRSLLQLDSSPANDLTLCGLEVGIHFRAVRNCISQLCRHDLTHSYTHQISTPSTKQSYNNTDLFR